MEFVGTEYHSEPGDKNFKDMREEPDHIERIKNQKPIKEISTQEEVKNG